MIDYEVQIFDDVYSVAAPLCASKKFVSKQIVSPSAFPAASLVEMDNSTVRERQSTSREENFATITYQLDVYDTTKAGCRKVYKAIDEKMLQLGFTRFSGTFVDDPNNTKVCRYAARYEANIDQDGVIYRKR